MTRARILARLAALEERAPRDDRPSWSSWMQTEHDAHTRADAAAYGLTLADADAVPLLPADVERVWCVAVASRQAALLARPSLVALDDE